MTASEYHEAVRTHDARMIRRQIGAIPKNINPTGRLYKKLIREIKASV